MTFILKILGSNSAIPAHDRNQTAQLLIIANHHILIDCGEGTQMQLNRFGVKPGRIKHIFISHLHGDHYFGLMGLLSSMHLYGRKSPLHLFAPPMLKEIINLQLQASGTVLSYPLIFEPLHTAQKEMILNHTKFTVEAFPLNHSIECYGFLFREKPKERNIIKEKLPENILIQHIVKLKSGKDVMDENGAVLYRFREMTRPPRKALSYAYCSDTSYDEALPDVVSGADLLYHEATFGEDMADRALQTQHSTAKEAATIAKKAMVGKLLIGHYSTRYKNLEPLLNDARSIFPETYLAIEGESTILEK